MKSLGMAERSTVAVVGGGMAGMIAALLLAERHSKLAVHLIEREPTIGGLWRSFDYGEHGLFDVGMHNVFEVGHPELDTLLLGLLPADQWDVLEGDHRDLAGVFYQGRLQTNSPSIDLRRLPEAERTQIIAEVRAAAATAENQSGGPAHGTAADFALQQFGRTVTERHIAPIMRRQFLRPLHELDVMAPRLTALSRVILADEAETLAMMKSDSLRARVAFPEQRNLPLSFSSGRKGGYPKQFGMQRVVDALRRRLTAAGVSILEGTEIRQLARVNGRISGLELARSGETTAIEDLRAVIWSAGMLPMAKTLGLSPEGIRLDRPREVRLVNLLVANANPADGLHYFYCYDDGLNSFRTTLCANYCSGARRAAGLPVTVELFDVPAEQAIDHAIAELQTFGILKDRSQVGFAAVEPLGGGFPMPTIANRQGFDLMRARLSEQELDNFHLVGVMAKPDIFFQGDVLKHVWEVTQQVAENPA
jgi:glycine/D-amino acid oxidase-like deaminating enzyme